MHTAKLVEWEQARGCAKKGGDKPLPLGQPLTAIQQGRTLAINCGEAAPA
ncbi:MAG: hypothetical protein QOH65_2949 [Methylobacteriaceae bacterium]|jgi:hypothetical protein|nr:hypothetical protein [Methylobacteriaceae bacterium]